MEPFAICVSSTDIKYKKRECIKKYVIVKSFGKCFSCGDIAYEEQTPIEICSIDNRCNTCISFNIKDFDNVTYENGGRIIAVNCGSGHSDLCNICHSGPNYDGPNYYFFHTIIEKL